MVVKVPHKKAGGVAVLSPEGRLLGIASGPLKTLITELLDEGIRKFIINFKSAITIDSPYVSALNSLDREIQRSDGRLIFCNAGPDILPWLEKYAPEIKIYKDEDLALDKLIGDTLDSAKGTIVVAGASDFATKLFTGIINYKGLTFYYFDDALKSIDKVVELRPMGILLNLEFGSIIVEPVRKWRFHEDTRNTPIILFGPQSRKYMVPALIREGADDYIEVVFEGPEILAYLKPLEFRNLLARKLDLILDGEFMNINVRKY